VGWVVKMLSFNFGWWGGWKIRRTFLPKCINVHYNVHEKVWSTSVCSKGDQNPLTGWCVSIMRWHMLSLKHVWFEVLPKLLKAVNSYKGCICRHEICLLAHILATSYDHQMHLRTPFYFLSKQNLVGFECMYFWQHIKTIMCSGILEYFPTNDSPMGY